MVKNYRIGDERIIPAADGGGPIWVYVNPDEQERKCLVEELSIDEHTLSSALDPDELSRLEFEQNHVALIFKRPRNYSARDELVFRVASIGAFLFRDRLVIVISEDIPLFDGKTFFRVGSLPGVVLRLIYRSIYHYLEHLKIMNMVSDELEGKINASMDNRYIINLFALEKSLVFYLNSITSNGVLIERLKNNAGKLGLTVEEQELLDDLLIENNQCYKQAEIHSNILASLMDARASIVGNNLNVLMKTLTIITISIMVPTLVVSIFSMNVRIPLANLAQAFWIIMGFALVSMGSVYFIWKRGRW
jgi:magnesium transporter